MYVGRDYDPSDTGEIEIYTLDFVNDLVNGETIASAVWTCTPIIGIDSNATSCVFGAATFSGTQTSQPFKNFVSGVYYQLLATVGTSLGNTKKLWSHVPARSPD